MHWERGAEVFAEWLLDHETACNAGNWQWLSCTAFYAQFYRCYSPVAFPQKWDKHGDFVKRYVPELANYEEKFIYEPWKASRADQKRWGCVIKGDGVDEQHANGEDGLKTYPAPIFDFASRRDICIRALKRAYAVGLHGDDERVKDGSWQDMFQQDGELGLRDGLASEGERSDDREDGNEDEDRRKCEDKDEEEKAESRKRKRDPEKGSVKERKNKGRTRAGQMTIEGAFGAK